MKNNGLFSTLFIEKIGKEIGLADFARDRMDTLVHAWKAREHGNLETLWETFMKQALGYLQFVPGVTPISPGVYPLFEDFGYKNCIAILCLIEPYADIDEKTVGKFWPAKLLLDLKSRKLNWGILTNGATWRLYSTKSSRPFEDFVELPLAEALESGDKREYALFERFFHKDSFVPEEEHSETEDSKRDEAIGVYKCRLDRDKEASEDTLDRYVKRPLLYQVDEVLQYLCNGFIADTPKKGEEYTEPERKEIFESAVKLLYRCLFFFYAEARRLLPSEREKAENYEKHSIRALCQEAHKFQWGKRKDNDGYDLWQHLKGLTNAVNEGDPEYGIMGYNGGLFDDEEEVFLGEHKLRNDFIARALYLLAYVEPYDGDPDKEYEIPYEDLEVRHLGELYENILEYTVLLADADRIRRRTKKGVEILLASETTKQKGDTVIKKGDVYFGESALERKQTGSYFTAESLVRFLNSKTVIEPLREKFEKGYRKRFDEFLEQARSGYDNATKRGAGRSAVALVERFVNEVILDFKVCDSAMGSGHFLVDVSNQMSGLVLELLAEVPDMQGLNTNVTSDPNHWRRLITRHCLFGVDLNPLAVDLAKLSLWLNCFAINHKLTFLDHRLRCGNSLIGLRTLDQLKTIPKRKKDNRQKSKQLLLPNFDDLSKTLAEVAQAANTITGIEEDDTDRQKETFDEAHRTTEERLAPLADLFTGYLMGGEINENDYRLLFDHFAKGGRASKISNPNLKEVWEPVESYKDFHHFFHWALEFPDVFDLDGKGGFDATIGNPPWDKVKPNSQEFFSPYIPKFRSYTQSEASRMAEQLMANNPGIHSKWGGYCIAYDEAINYFHQPSNYQALGSGDINTFKLFVERYFGILEQTGRIGVVLPSALYIDRGCQQLRKLFFENSRIDFLYCFENRRAIFNIHRSFKFVLFGTQKGGKTDEFKCAFMEHDPERLPAIEKASISVPIETIRSASSYLSILEYKTRNDINVCNKLFSHHSIKAQEGILFAVFFSDEIHLTKASKARIISDVEDFGRVLWEGKMINLFDSFFSQPTMWIDEKAGKEFLANNKYKENIRFWFENYRLSYRRVAASTNERTLLASIIPEGVFSSYSLYNVLLDSGKQRAFYEVPTLKTQAFLLGIMASFIFDFVARLKFSINLVPSEVCEIPVPDMKSFDGIVEYIIARTARLICINQDFARLWQSIFSNKWKKTEFWYPGTENYKYGPAHEQEIRARLRDEAKKLSPEWSTHCGVYDRTPNRRDTGDRAQLRAEIDAYVAHLYGLSREEFAYILDTFPVLKRKEEQAFGEYISKRKCLEEYDRIKTILNAE